MRQRVAELPEKSCERLEIGVSPVLEKTVEPMSASFDDAVECPPAGWSQVNERGTPVLGIPIASHEPFSLELLDLAGNGRCVHSEQVRECGHAERPVQMELVEKGCSCAVESYPGCLEQAFVQTDLGY